MKSLIFSKSLTITGSSYSVLSSWFNIGYQTTEVTAAHPACTSGTLQNWYVEVTTAPGAGTSWTFEVYKNDVATGLQVVISGTATSGSNVINSMSFTPGDTLVIKIDPTGAPAATGVVTWSLECESQGQMLMTGLGGNVSNTASNYFSLMSCNAITSPLSSVIPTNGTISTAYVKTSAGVGAAKSYTCTLVVNGVDTSLVVTVTGAGVQTASDTTHSVTVSAGDTAYWRIDPSGTPTAARVKISALFTPAIAGESMYSVASSSNNSTSATQYQSVVGGGAMGPNGTESNRANSQTICPLTIKKLYIVTSSSPGTSKSYTYTIYSNGSATPITAAVSGTGTTANNTTSVAPTNIFGSSLSIQSVPSGTPTASEATISFVLYHPVGNFLGLMGS